MPLLNYFVLFLVEIVLFVLITVATIGAFIALCGITQGIWRKYAARKHIKLHGINKSQFEAAIKSGDVDRQTQFLRCTDPGRLSLTTEQYFKLLVEMEPHITEEPALSQYYQKRIELEEILRQERHG